MFQFINDLTWYPPAETKIPWAAICSTFIKSYSSFRDELCAYLEVDNCVLGENARGLLYRLLEVLKKKDGYRRDEILIPGYTCYSVAAAAAKAGLKISAYDIDPKTLHADINSIEKNLSDKTLAIITQHLFGILTPTDELKKIANKNDVFLIEDAAQALGKSQDDIIPGTIGDFGLFSFGRGKPLPVGAGGAVVSRKFGNLLNEMDIIPRDKGYKQTLIAATSQIISKPALYWLAEMLPLGLGKTIFNPWFHSKGIPEAVEKMLLKSLPTLNLLNANRKVLSKIYIKHISSKNTVKHKIDDIVSLIRFPVLIDGHELKSEWMQWGPESESSH